jgi:AcrR family transcriptional regulator
VREAVLRAAGEELSCAGFERFSISEVARRAGVHETSVYRRWGSRAALIADVSRNAIGSGITAPDTGSLRTDLIEMLEQARSMLQSPLGVSLVHTSVAAVSGDEFFEGVVGFWRHRLDGMAMLFERARARGEWPTAQAWRPCFDCLSGALHFRLFLTKEGLSSEDLHELVDYALRGAFVRA